MTLSGSKMGHPGVESAGLGDHRLPRGRTGVVELTIPAEPRYVGLVRRAAAALAGDLGFTLHEVEDVRAAVNELCAAVITHLDTPQLALHLRFVWRAGTLVARGWASVPPDGPSGPIDVDPVAREILRITTSSFELCAAPDQVSFRMEKRGESFIP